jgi:acyl carrier protein
VKVRGYRVELGEVEAELKRCRGVKEGAVVARGEGAGKGLVGYVVGEVEEEGIKRELRGRLPEYLVPGVVVKLEAMPLTPSGKVDRRRLPAPEQAREGRVYVAPRTAVEAQVAELCQELLKVERVGAEDNFFELGGHSLLATQLMSRVRQSFQVELPLRVLFEAPTIAQLAARIEAAPRAAAEPAAPAIVPVSREARRVRRSSLGGERPGEGGRVN